VRIGVIALVTNMVLNLAFALPLDHYFGIGHVGLALATSLAAMLNAGLLFRGLYRLGIYCPAPGWRRFLLTLLGANLLMAMALWGFTTYLDQWLLWSGWQRAGWMLLVCLSGMLVYILFLLVGGMRPSHLRHR